jgi:hypothetical protein
MPEKWGTPLPQFPPLSGLHDGHGNHSVYQMRKEGCHEFAYSTCLQQ